MGAKIGHIVSKETIKKIRLAQIGKPRLQTTGRKNGMWKGKNAGYVSIHTWVKRHYPIKKCEICHKIYDGTKRFHWACKTHNFKNRKRDNWIFLCVKCHTFYDVTFLNKKLNSWSKNPNNTPKMRQCSICRNILPLTIKYFHKSYNHTFGFKYVCKKCRSKQAHLNWINRTRI